MTAIALMLAGCGIRPTGIVDAGSAPMADHEHQRNVIYLLKKDRLTRVERAGMDGDTLLPLHQLGLGPTADELRAGITTAVPGGLGYVRDDTGVLRVVNGNGPGEHGRGSLTRTARAQIACTADARGTGTPSVGFPSAARSTRTSSVRFPGDRRTYACADFRDLR
ncbi:hypothetical protein [Actinomadura sp. HBU206391]|uniref:hypothetical protein n=1 Tax=Actinomadura sp. HBU206391 TaxID=2731692 RepID=UPI00164F9337|nr:hypothetical protein [Actinomadura sp. HBU206391]MBC6462563.1 hypothetical protein [Actinomadura sp. HBU206391]